MVNEVFFVHFCLKVCAVSSLAAAVQRLSSTNIQRNKNVDLFGWIPESPTRLGLYLCSLSSESFMRNILLRMISRLSFDQFGTINTFEWRLYVVCLREIREAFNGHYKNRITWPIFSWINCLLNNFSSTTWLQPNILFWSFATQVTYVVARPTTCSAPVSLVATIERLLCAHFTCSYWPVACQSLKCNLRMKWSDVCCCIKHLKEMAGMNGLLWSWLLLITPHMRFLVAKWLPRNFLPSWGWNKQNCIVNCVKHGYMLILVRVNASRGIIFPNDWAYGVFWICYNTYGWFVNRAQLAENWFWLSSSDTTSFPNIQQISQQVEKPERKLNLRSEERFQIIDSNREYEWNFVPTGWFNFVPCKISWPISCFLFVQNYRKRCNIPFSLTE